MANYVVPTSADIQQIAQVKAPRLEADRLIFQYMPIRTRDASLIMWEQGDNYKGLQQIRGINGEPPKVQPTGVSQFQMQPGVYGEFTEINELELTNRRQYGTFGQPIDLSDLVMERQDLLLQRRYDRIEYIGWTLLTTGTFSVAHANGATVHTDTFPLQTYSAGTGWATVATSTPLADLRAVQLLGRGKGVNLGAGSTAIMNRVTANALLGNTNTADLGGKRTGGFGTFNSLQQMNELFTMDDLPNIIIYDEGYLNDSGTFVPYIADNKVVVIGRRPAGQTIAEYQMVRNVNNPGFAPGPYMKVVADEDEVPFKVEVHDGHSGGPAIYFPGSIVVMSV